MGRTLRPPTLTQAELCERWSPVQQELARCIVDWVQVEFPAVFVRPIRGYDILSLERPPGGLRLQLLYVGPHRDESAIVLGFPNGNSAPDPGHRLYGNALRMRRFRLDERPELIPWHLLQPLLDHELKLSTSLSPAARMHRRQGPGPRPDEPSTPPES